MAELELKLDGEPGQIGATALAALLDQSLSLLREAAEAQQSPVTPWRVTELNVNSLAVSVDAPSARPIIDFLTVGIESLRLRSEIPVGWTHRMVRRVLHLARLDGHQGVTGVSISTPSSRSRLDAQVAAHAEEALGSAEVSFGSVTGTIDTWNNRSGRTVGLTRDGGLGTVLVQLTTDQEEDVRIHALGQHVEVAGHLTRNSAGQVTKLALTGWTLLGTEPAATADDLMGLWADPTGPTTQQLLARRGEW